MFRMLFIFSLMKRVKYMKAQGVFRKCGEKLRTVYSVYLVDNIR